MTIWQPRIARQSGSKYLAIAEALADDIASGKLAPGMRLPTHRALAERIGVTVGTVTRGYAEAQRRGLLSGEVGRGSFVRRRDAAAPSAVEGAPDAPVDFRLNLPASGDGARRLAETLGQLAREPLNELLDYNPAGDLSRHRSAGAEWLKRAGLFVGGERVVVTNGTQHGMAIAFLALAKAGDVILTAELTFHGMKELAGRLGLLLAGLPTDAEGIAPEAFDEACRTQHPRALYCMPNLQNPTAAVMGKARRQAIVEIARRHDVIIVEDDVYGFLLGDKALPPLAALAPELTYYITSLSKCVAPGLRVGYVLAPAGKTEAIVSAARATCRMATPLMAEIAARWISDGVADALVEFQRREAAARREIAARVLAGIPSRTHPKSLHLWIPLPDPWRSETFVAELKAKGVWVLPAETFAVGRAPVPHAVRVCLGSARGRAAVERGLELLAATLRAGPQPAAAVV
ncbi:MAG: PLP-dependent aminotransferase family protein [Rhodospirillales bacterium]|nr:PLP-dependent aminotransferase family protein [Rhodospirillales bacterium]